MVWDGGEETIDEEVLRLPTDEIVTKTRLLENEIRVIMDCLSVSLSLSLSLALYSSHSPSLCLCQCMCVCVCGCMCMSVLFAPVDCASLHWFNW